MKLVSARQMQELDRQTIQIDKTPQKTLMQRAGRAVAGAAKALLQRHCRVLVLAGSGNNGADALIAGRLLKAAKYHVQLVELAQPKQAVVSYEGVDLVIDGIFGTGLSRPVKGEYQKVIQSLNEAKKRFPRLQVLAVDIPSGLNADTGKPMGIAVMADLTVTLGLPKLGLVQQPALDYVGKLTVADIGFSKDRIAQIKTPAHFLTSFDVASLIRARKPVSFKNNYGHVLVVAGSVGFHGAAWMTAHGALAAGAGLVTLAVPRSIYAAVADQCRQVMVAPIEDDGLGIFTSSSWKDLEPLLKKKTAFAVGPGIGTAQLTLKFLEQIFTRMDAPAVLDADALNLLSRKLKLLKTIRPPVILTPHPGEMARLTNSTTAKVQVNRMKVARNFVSKHKVTLVLKGAHTLIADSKDPGSVTVNSTGNASLATGGSGDVLTGMITGFAAQKLDAADAAKLGVFVHGLAAEQLAPEPVLTGLKVEELLEAVPFVLRSLFMKRS